MKALCPKLLPLKTYLDALNMRMDLETVGHLLLESNITIDDVRNQCSFQQSHYKRNKLASGKWYDLLLICWKPGQSSLIHDHNGSSCGFKVLSGTCTELRYEKDENNRVSVCGKDSVAAGSLCLARDADIHRVLNESDSDDLVTLHIYSPPLQMTLYESTDPREQDLLRTVAELEAEGLQP